MNGAILLSGGSPIRYILSKDDYETCYKNIDAEAKMTFLNYPHNPTGAVLTNSTLYRLIELAKSKRMVICYDNVYSEITFDSYSAQVFYNSPQTTQV